MKKVLFISSTGGHFSELLQLKPLFKKYDSYIITEKDKTSENLKEEYGEKFFFLPYGTRSKLFTYIFKYLYLCLKTIYLYFKIRPKYIVTTGTHTAVPMCYIGKLFGSKIIFIETFANSKSKTLSGRMIYPIANLFIVQWKEMLELYPKAVYGGSIYWCTNYVHFAPNVWMFIKNGEVNMILVLLGTQNNSFTRLLQAIQDNIDKKVITDKVIVQAGFTKFDSKDMKIFSMMSKKEFSKLQDEADLIITHAGVGSIISSLEKGKKVIVVPRLKRYNEHVNDHQIQIAKKFKQQGYVKYVINLKNLGKVIKSMENFTPKEYKKSESNIISIIENYIDNN